jgi:hypothetical protein
MKKITLTLILFAISIITNAQVSIPDPNFEGALVTFGMDTDGLVNGQISTTDALAITNLSIANQNITDLTGVNSMTNLTYFSCYGNSLSNFNFILPNLETLSVEYNNFTSIDLSGVPNLITLRIDNNPSLTMLDLTPSPLLEILNARNCSILSIIPDANFIYTQIRLSNNAFIGNIDLTNLTLATIIDFSNNTLTSVDVTGLTNLGFLAVDHCGLADLDVTTNVNLTSLTAIDNNLTCLDLSQNPLLTGVEVNSNDPSLIIVVADVAAANASTGIYQWWSKDATASYDTTCGTTNINDSSLANNFKIFPNPVIDTLNIQSMQNSTYILYDINGRLILKGYFQIGNNTMDLSSFDSGIYFLRVLSLHKSFTRKLILK